jgi:transposase
LNALFDSLPEEARQALQSLQADKAHLSQENARLNFILKLKDEQIRLLNLKLWGPKGEKLSVEQMQLLLQEISVLEAELAQEAQLPEAQKPVSAARPARRPRAAHPGRDKLPEHLERRQEIIPCHPKDCRCEQCGQERPVIGYETREELVCEPATFYVRVTKREKRGSHCLEEQGVATAPAPAQIVPKSKLSNEFVIETLAQKYQQHVPVYRQCAVLEREHGIELDRKTVGDGILAAGDLLQAVVRSQAVELKAGGYLQADETPVLCQTEEKSGRNHKAYLWEYSRPGGPVVFDFQMSRARSGLAEFLKGFQGKLQSDGYAAYDKLGEGITYVGCLTHARRGLCGRPEDCAREPAAGGDHRPDRKALRRRGPGAGSRDGRSQPSGLAPREKRAGDGGVKGTDWGNPPANPTGWKTGPSLRLHLGSMEPVGRIPQRRSPGDR